MQDEIVDEVRRLREEHAARFDYDVDAIYAELKRIEQESKRPHSSLRRRPKTIAQMDAGIAQEVRRRHLRSRY